MTQVASETDMTGDDLLALLPQQELLKYYEPIPFQDAAPGFSIKRNYPNTIPYKPPLDKSGKPDTSCMIRLLIKENRGGDEFEFKCDTTKFSHFGHHFFHSGEESENGPTKAEFQKSNRTPQPIDLQYEDQSMRYNASTHLFSFNNKKYTLAELLELVFFDHVNSTKHFSHKRMKYSIANLIWTLKHFLLDFLIPTLVWALKGFGRILEKFDYPNSLLVSNSEKDMTTISTTDFSILGYKISKNGMVIFSSIIVIIYCISYTFDIHFSFVTEIYKSPFLTIVFSVVGLWTVDELIPTIFHKILIALVKSKRRNLVFHVKF